MKKFIAMPVLIIMITALGICSAYAESFSDTGGHWAEYTIDALFQKGIINGVSEDMFCPDNNVTRAEFLKLAMACENIQTALPRKGECLDAPIGSWYAPYLQKALDYSLIPKNMITGYAKNLITDPETGESKVIYRGAFNGDIPITREEAAVIAQAVYQFSRTAENAKYINTTVSLSFSDRDEISPWAKYGVALAVSNGFITGMDDGSFMPKSFSTRAQAAVIISRMIDKN